MNRLFRINRIPRVPRPQQGLRAIAERVERGVEALREHLMKLVDERVRIVLE